MAREPRTAVLVVRAWIEDDPVTGFRARVTRSLDVEARDERATVAGSPEAVLAMVREWLEELTSNAVDAAPCGAPDDPG